MVCQHFEMVNFPFMDSCIPKKSSLGVFYSQLLSYARICSRFLAFKVKSMGLVETLIRQGYKLEDLRRISLRFFRAKNNILQKYDLTDGNMFVRELFQIE